jgi:putative FmdB family regulatory protein
MPFYEYECPHCGYHDEVLQKITDAPLKKCPSCGKNGLKKLISAPVFRLKGSGWYETDFKSDKENKRNLHGDAEPKSDTKSEPAKPETKSEAKTESKPEAKPAAEKPAAKPVKTAAKSRARHKSARKQRR